MQTNLCQFWCLLKGEAIPFKVIADVRKDMYDLTELIQGEIPALRSRCLGYRPVESEHVLMPM